jgi:hypothetical protein
LCVCVFVCVYVWACERGKSNLVGRVMRGKGDRRGRGTEGEGGGGKGGRLISNDPFIFIFLK